ncbi:cytochrome c [Larsenimonas rhizosphaerae]|uniref:Cytochrome c n=1 Tax=Larsenimonas rhizosphaerae TaxID=2944682 RepID=A0AA41ZPB5_9GAMM|nr:cytochrome c [Larsenimonas rhizosphaerae]MCX2524700.1 cytochrome c [Larsenimonas rhizosphaerae]
MRTSLVFAIASSLGLLATQSALAAESADSNSMSRGAYIARTADCTACHTTDESKPFAGGLAMPTPMGDIYSTNITPDKSTGIGNYSLEDFTRVLREGVDKGGDHLYPAMPYTAYTKMSDSDIKALYDYFMNEVKPVNAPNRESDIPWPLSMRWPLMAWNWMFLDKGVYQADEQKSDAWNRGAYLVQGATHCSTCHTPRGLAMQEKSTDETEKGFLSGADLGGWHAFNITNDKAAGLGSWSDEDIVQYLKTGSVKGKAQAAGPMGEAVEHSFRFMSDSDLHAIATYLRSVPAVDDGKTMETSRFTQGEPVAVDMVVRGQDPEKAMDSSPGAELFMGNCATCHAADGSGSPDGYYPSLYHNSVVGTTHLDNLTRVILEGVHRENNHGELFMPAFGESLTDEQVATLVNFLTSTFGNPEATTTAEAVGKLRSKD